MGGSGDGDNQNQTRFTDDALRDDGRQDGCRDNAVDVAHDSHGGRLAAPLPLPAKRERRKPHKSTGTRSSSPDGRSVANAKSMPTKSAASPTNAVANAKSMPTKSAASPTNANPDSSTPMTSIDPRERHKLAERERRKSMRELFLSLHAMLPNGDEVRTEQSAILDEIVKYIPVAASRLRSLRMEAQRRRPRRRRLDIPEVANAGEASLMAFSSSNNSASAASASSSSSSACSSSSISSSPSSSSCSSSGNPKQPDAKLSSSPSKKRQREESSNGIFNYFYSCSSRGSTNSLSTLATPSARTGVKRSAASAPICSSMRLTSTDGVREPRIDIRLGRKPASSVSIRLRGDRVNLSLTKDFSSSYSSLPPLLLSTVLDELDTHRLDLVRSTHCRDGSKLLHYSESKIRPDESEARDPPAVMDTLEDLASTLHGIRARTATTIPSSGAASPSTTGPQNSVEETPLGLHRDRKRRDKGGGNH